MLNLRDLDAAAMDRALAPHGADAALSRRIFAAVHRDGARTLTGVRALPREVRLSLEKVLEFPPDLEVVERRRAADGFVKYLFRLPDGHLVETVRIPLPASEDTKALKERRRRGEAGRLEPLPTHKYTVCLSSQVGCALACDFCATGRLGAIRSLATWEILAQLRQVAAEADHPVRGAVFMGMGEPFLNYDAVIRAARVICDPAGPAISAKSITISTAGVVPMIRRFTAERHKFKLIVSLSGATSADRLAVMPIEKRWPLPDLLAAVREYEAARGGPVTLAYVGLGGVNMSPDHARKLAELLAGMRAKVNLIEVSDETGAYAAPTEDEIRIFRDLLSAAKIPVIRRYSGGKEIGAACGTLSASQDGGALVELRRPASA